MSTVEVNLCIRLLKLQFGEPVQAVGAYLLKQPCKRPLVVIQSNVAVPKRQVRVCLCVLIMHNLVELAESNANIIEYGMKPEVVLTLMYQPIYIDYIKESFGDIAEIIISKIVEHGKLTAKMAIQETLKTHCNNAKEAIDIQKANKVEETFKKLVIAKFIFRIAQTQQESKDLIPNLSVPKLHLFDFDEVDLQEIVSSLNSEEEPVSKKIKPNETSKVYWGVNHERFNLRIRDRVIVSAVESSINKKASEVIKVALQISEKNASPILLPTSQAIGFFQIAEGLKKISSSVDEKDLDKYLSILTHPDENFMSKADAKSGGMYVVNIHKILEKLAEENASCIVENRFGSKYSRIFRLLLKHKYLEQKEIETLSMMSPKDAKEHTYRMLQERFLDTQEISKMPDYSTNRMFFLFHTDISKVSKMLLRRYIQGAFNLLLTYETQIKEQRRILDKKARVDAIVVSLVQGGGAPDQIEEVKQMITPQEQASLDKVENISTMIFKSFNELSEMTLILNMYLQSVVSNKV